MRTEDDTTERFLQQLLLDEANGKVTPYWMLRQAYNRGHEDGYGVGYDAGASDFGAGPAA